MKIDKDTFGNGGCIDEDCAEIFADELGDREGTGKLTTKESMKCFLLPSGTRIAVIDGLYEFEEDKPEDIPATIIVCTEPTQVLCYDKVRNRVGIGDRDVYLEDSQHMISIGAEPVELERSDNPSASDAGCAYWGVTRIVVCQ